MRRKPLTGKKRLTNREFAILASYRDEGKEEGEDTEPADGSGVQPDSQPEAEQTPHNPEPEGENAADFYEHSDAGSGGDPHHPQEHDSEGGQAYFSDGSEANNSSYADAEMGDNASAGGDSYVSRASTPANSISTPTPGGESANDRTRDPHLAAEIAATGTTTVTAIVSAPTTATVLAHAAATAAIGQRALITETAPPERRSLTAMAAETALQPTTAGTAVTALRPITAMTVEAVPQPVAAVTAVTTLHTNAAAQAARRIPGGYVPSGTSGMVLALLPRLRSPQQ